MEQNILTMTTTEWNEACFNLFSIQVSIQYTIFKHKIYI